MGTLICYSYVQLFLASVMNLTSTRKILVLYFMSYKTRHIVLPISDFFLDVFTSSSYVHDVDL